MMAFDATAMIRSCVGIAGAHIPSREQVPIYVIILKVVLFLEIFLEIFSELIVIQIVNYNYNRVNTVPLSS